VNAGPFPIASSGRMKNTPLRPLLSVSELTSQIKQAIDSHLGRLWIQGEVCNYKGPNARGHLYFSLKDDKASIDIKMWATQAQNLRFRLEEGMALLAMGTVEVYAPMGRYSLIAAHLEPEGFGAQALALQQLKTRLAEEGLWGPKRKRPPRPLPLLPRRIGIVTSITGAALRDFLKVLLRRHPRLSILARDARVQGTQAAAEMVAALRQLYASDVDVVVLARGGGSTEDLAAFNEEVLARTVFESPVPIVSAVGHEVDVSLCDLTADVRAPTPSAAAELLSPVLSELELQLGLERRRLKNAMQRLLALSHANLRALSQRLLKGHPQRNLAKQSGLLHHHKAKLQAAWQKRVTSTQNQLAEMYNALHGHNPRLLLLKHQQTWGALGGRLVAHMKAALESRRRHQGLLAAQLEALSPLAVLSRGYALLKDEATGRWLLSPEGIYIGQGVEIHMAGGRGLRARIVAPLLEEKP